MINKIARLSADLRKEGLPVSIRSTQSAMEVYLNFGDEDRNLLKTALILATNSLGEKGFGI